MISLIYGGETNGVSKRVFNSIKQSLEKKEQDLQVVDLSEESLNLSLEQGYQTERDPRMVEIQDQLKQSDTLIFVYPLYWLNVPMRLKGFIDSVLWPNEAFSFKKKDYYHNGYWRGKKAFLIYTLGGPEWLHKIYRSSGLMAVKYPLKFSGVMKVKHYFIENINSSKVTEEKINHQIAKISEKLTKQVAH
ncbi:NAD(P)H-dependent oxidoreductase [Ignavigranum ruoffiae]|uniref:NAD(P)H-dependent oxidoreductase n=1 Tax=Ignavigranum ruoffiae TaxID=89093 RepID=UPI00204AEAB7|nr:NAD(P)H-dependent oxidoreductase [Ignavigranum ruoffiae]UPQ85119.1 NAD(P)H-dependent oxidoreductase [Ignavigranum ruoffiae]